MELTSIKGIGEARKQSFAENDIFSCEDLINYFPYKYYDFSKTEPYADDGKVRLIKATATDSPKIVKIRAGLSFVTCNMIDEIGHAFNAVWYNQTYIKSQVYLGAELYLYGKNNPKKRNTFIVNIHKFADKFDKLGLLPVYHSISGIGQQTLNDTINKSLEVLNLSTFIPNQLLYKYNLIDLWEAYNLIHNPLKEEDVYESHKRIQVEKLVPILAVNEYHKLKSKEIKTHQYEGSALLKSEFEKLLPFSLTPDQQKAIFEIEKDMSSKFSMNRLLQGDVGSGKTVVSFFGAYLAAKSGHQAVIIAPTEILANQHFKTAQKLFDGINFNITVLTGSTKGMERQIAISNIETGKSKIVIGTHALLSENLVFDDLTYVAIDEQHRFGVAQRAKLKQKGNSPDILVMSATPIPRTLALVVYGNLEISTINNRPKDNNIKTNIVAPSKQDDMWNYIKTKLVTGSKTYVVCSRIDEENDDDEVLKFSAKNMYDYLCTVFDKNDVALIHGKLSKETQNKTIEKFRTGQVKVLVSTTIVEVGVDVPDADIMVIATPDRFGLATLHQLRGRIGRNGAEAHCFCLADGLNEKSYNRIKYFKDNLNGFDIADFDLKNRGSGSIIGTNQHGKDDGIMANFSVESFRLASEILEQLKPNISLYSQILGIGEQIVSSNSYNKIVLN